MTRHFCVSLLVFGLWNVAANARDDETPASEPAAADAKSEPAKPEGRKYDLKYKFKPGETVRTEVVHRATVQTTIQGTNQTAETLSKSIKVWKVEDVAENGTFKFVHSVESIEMWQKSQGRQEVRYNSQTDTEVPPGYEEVAKAVGVPLTLATMDDRGTIVKREEKRAQPMSMSTQMTMPLAKDPVAVGDTWSSPMDIDVVLKDNSTKKVRTRQQFTLEKVDDDVATIGVDTHILTPINDPAIEAQLIQRLSKGSVRFDIAAGRVLSQQLDLDRHVIGFSGPSSSMHYLTRFTEQLLKETEQTARGAGDKSAAVRKKQAPRSAAASKKSTPAR